MKRGLITRVLAVAALLMASGNAPAYYYYIQFDANGKAVPWKWDLTTLSNNTVNFYVADSGLNTAAMNPGDGYETLVSELRAAAGVWNSAPGSAIRIGYGGLFHSNGTASNAGINVEFSDNVPLGLLAYSLVTTQASTKTPTPTPIGAAFLPLKSTILVFPTLPYGLNGPGVPLATWSELFFTTAVHEFGHNLGLQHSTTSAAMSTYETSGVTKAEPLSADDIAAVSLLYPAGDFVSTTGSIAGRVTFTDGTPVNLAAVVAAPVAGDAVGAMTLPDGTYRIDGVPPGYYFVYAQSVPPAQQGESARMGLTYPLAADGVTSLPPTCDGPASASMCYFETTFYPGANDWHLATEIGINAGSLNSAINIQVSPRATMAVNSVRTFGYPSGIPVGPPPLVINGAPLTLLLEGNGLFDATGKLSQGLSFDTLGWLLGVKSGSPGIYQGFVSVGVQAYPCGVMDVVRAGARHLVVNGSDGSYVLPAGVRAVTGPSPSVTSVQALANGTVEVSGTNFTSQTRIVFDGAAGAPVKAVGSTQLIVTPPVARQGFVGHVEALNPDGQSSLYVSGDSGVATYTWPGSGAPSLAVTSGTLTAGGSTTVDVIGTNTDFVQGQTYVGFGTSSVVVTNVNVLNPGHLQATAKAASGTAVPTTAINVTTGLSIISQALGYSVVSQ
ncbi:MAG: matrixin family metalloprotease [Bryobacteraceae bacterium]|jgi:hypothetical protein